MRYSLKELSLEARFLMDAIKREVEGLDGKVMRFEDRVVREAEGSYLTRLYCETLVGQLRVIKDKLSDTNKGQVF